MRWFDITLFLIIFQFVNTYFLTIAPSMGFSGELYQSPTFATESVIAILEAAIVAAIITTQITGTAPLSIFLGWGAAVTAAGAVALFEFARRFFLGISLTLQLMGVPAGFAHIFHVVYWIIVIVGIFQVATGKEIM